jgi:peptidyl-prolyl cis-trans isomerase A (cyclophilin A)
MIIRSLLFASVFCATALHSAFAQSNKRNDSTKVVLTTTMGEITIVLFDQKAPITVKNFLAYVDSGFYNGTIFHRVIPGFVIQGGGYTADMRRKETLPPIENESRNGLRNRRGTLSMARTNDPNSATSQFFINLADNRNLDYGPRGPGYAVFGMVIEGMEIVDKIARVPTETREVFQNVPKEPIVIITARRK